MNSSSINEIRDLFASTLAEVIHTVSGFSPEVVSCDCSEVSALDSPVEPGELVGIMSFTGNNRGMLFISVSEKDMRTLCSYITGTAADELEQSDIEDSLCEIVNMTSGSAKMHLPNNDFLYLLPWTFIVKGKEVSVSAKRKTPVATALLSCNEISVGVKVVADTTGAGKIRVL